jgi:hypothetical protein
MFRTDDPLADYDRHQDEIDEWMNSLPKCAYCGEPIQDEQCYLINEELIHIDCAHEYLHDDCRVNIDDYMGRD